MYTETENDGKVRGLLVKVNDVCQIIDTHDRLARALIVTASRLPPRLRYKGSAEYLSIVCTNNIVKVFYDGKILGSLPETDDNREVGEAGDKYERHSDAVADRVVASMSIIYLLNDNNELVQLLRPDNKNRQTIPGVLAVSGGTHDDFGIIGYVKLDTDTDSHELVIEQTDYRPNIGQQVMDMVICPCCNEYCIFCGKSCCLGCTK